MTLTDSHCHLEAADFTVDGVDQRAEVIARARAAGVRRLICVGSGGTIAQIDNAVAFAEAHDFIWATVGIHPHDSVDLPPDALAIVEKLAATHPRVVAVGEIGLDFYYDHSPPDVQRAVFRSFLGVARRTHKPVTLHVRDAHDETLAILGEEQITSGVVHCFTGNRADAERYLAKGLHLSFSGIVTFKSAAQIKEVAATVPLDRILLETDCPYLAPVPLRGKKNEPAYLVHTAAFVAALRGISVAELAAASSANCDRLFGLTGLSS